MRVRRRWRRENVGCHLCEWAAGRGAWAFHENPPVALVVGNATIEIAVSVSSLVPPNALRYTMDGSYSIVGNPAGDLNPVFRLGS
jgi:hypothetical protein